MFQSFVVKVKMFQSFVVKVVKDKKMFRSFVVKVVKDKIDDPRVPLKP